MLLSSIMFSLHAQKPAYKLYNGKGKKSDYSKMVAASAGADVVLFGELHTNPISHWLQFELTRDLYTEVGADLMLGAEMFEADNQLLIDEYFQGLITETKFEEEARLWKNYRTDYKPLVVFAKDHSLNFVATNIPRRYANSVFKQGIQVLNELSDQARSYIAPLPLEYDTSLNCYKDLMGGGAAVSETPMVSPKEHVPMGGAGMKDGKKGMATSLADAQAIKDATMSHFILRNWSPGKVFLHYNGAYHSDYGESMNWFLLRERPELKIVTISTVSQKDLDKLEKEFLGKADFIICVPESMTQTSR